MALIIASSFGINSFAYYGKVMRLFISYIAIFGKCYILINIIINSMSNKTIRQEVIYNGNKPLERVFHNATSRVLDFLITSSEFDYSASQISNLTGIPLRTVHRLLQNVVETQLVKETRMVGNMRMYMFNTHSELAQTLKQYVYKAMNMNIEKSKKIIH